MREVELTAVESDTAKTCIFIRSCDYGARADQVLSYWVLIVRNQPQNVLIMCSLN